MRRGWPVYRKAGFLAINNIMSSLFKKNPTTQLVVRAKYELYICHRIAGRGNYETDKRFMLISSKNGSLSVSTSVSK